MAFTQSRINNLKPKDKRYTLSDDNLLILVEPSGSINFYTYIERKQIKLGSHPKLTLRQAVKKKNFQINQHYMGTLEVTKETFAQYVHSAAFTDWSKGTRKTHEERMASMERTILPIIGKVKLSKLVKGDITRYKNARLATGVTEATINRELNDIASVLTQAKEQGVIHQTVKIEKYREDKGKEIHVLEQHQVRALRKAARRKEGTAWQRYQRKHIPVIIDIALFCGLRTGEILDLRWGDIVYRGYDLNELKEEGDSQTNPREEAIAFLEAERNDYAFNVKGQKTKTKRGTKTGQSRLVPIDGYLAEVLLKYYSSFVGANANPEYAEKIIEQFKDSKSVERLEMFEEIFKDKTKTIATLENVMLNEDKDKRIFPFNKINEAINTAVEKAGLSKDITLRTLRHHFCTYSLESGMTLQEVKVLAGHASITTTERYLHTNPKRKFQAYKKYSALIHKQIGTELLNN